LAVRLGIVIVHYNTPEDLARCLRSLQDHAPTCSHEVVVVDNASSAPGLDDLQLRHPDVRWLLNTENRGYGRGCNQGLAAVAADYHLILNPDIVVQPGALDALLDFADRHPRAGLIGPQLLNEDGTIQESCRRFYTFWTLVLRRTPLARLARNSRIVQRHLMRDFDHESVRPVDWVLGGCLLVRREARDRCGPMDERFFLYFEDVDWCYRMWRSGFEVVYFPGARFVHRHRRASARGTFTRSFWLHLASLISYYEKWSMLVYAVKKWRRPLEVALHWSLDMALLAVALLGAYGLRDVGQPLFATELLPLSWYRGWLVYAGILVTVAFVLLGRYRTTGLRAGPDWGAHLKQVGLVTLLLLAGSYLGRQEVMSRAVLLVLLVLYSGLTIWASAVIGRLHRRLEEGYLALERTLLAGPRTVVAGWLAASGDLRRLAADPVGYVTDEPAPPGGHLAIGVGDVPWLGTWAELPDLVDRFRVSQVVFWQQPGDDVQIRAILVKLRRLRIRLRWILADAWLLAAGARAETFGAAESGVLDPDDGGTLSRLALRPLAVLVAAPLLLVAGLLAAPRWLRLRSGAWRWELVDLGGIAAHNDRVAILCDRQGRTLPLWWQSGLAFALLRGRVGVVGARLGAAGGAGDTAAALRDADSAVPGLTGRWARDAGGGARQRRMLTEFLLNPGGWTQRAGDGGIDRSRGRGQEVEDP